MVGPGASQSSNTETVSATENCAQPLSWTIGSIDQRFNIDKQTLKSVMIDVSDLWAKAAGRKVMAYRDSGQVSLSLIYGKGQKFTDNERQLSQRINRMKLHHFALENDYEQLFYNHQKKRARYDSLGNELMERVDNYNWTIARRSDTGVVEKLENERLSELKKMVKKLEGELKATEKELNEEAKKLTLLSTRLDNVADQVNKRIFSYNDRFGSARTFYQGVFIDDINHQKINIYEFENMDRLRLVLAHEVGHALGLGHVNNPKSIMYYIMEKQNERNLQLTKEDVRAIDNRCSGIP
jgi:predicted Zn-dependent protease with MMP-like domain